MLINNPFQANDWKFDRFIKAVLALQLLVLLIEGLELKGINIPVVTQLITFIYLTFVPGFLILRILRLHKLGNISSIIFAVALSLLSLMFIGFFMNMIYPSLGIIKPITLSYLVISITAYVLVLCVLSYLLDRNYSTPSFIDTKTFLSSKFYFLCTLPFLAIFGSYLVTNYDNNIVTFVLILLVGSILVLYMFDRIPKELDVFTIWIAAISLLFMSSLISTYVWGWDIQNEFYLASVVLKNHIWNYTLFDAYDAMLSIVMLSPIYSIVTNMSLDWVLKIIFPFFLSLVPIGLYKIFKDQTKHHKIAFLAVFLFISFSTYYIELISLTREITAEVFLIAMLLLIFNSKFKANLIVLFMLMSMGLVVSHYSTTFFFLAAIIVVIIILGLFNLFFTNIKLNKSLIVTLVVVPLVTIFFLLFTYVWYYLFAAKTALLGLIDTYIAVNTGILTQLTHITSKVGLSVNTGIYLILLVVILVAILLTYIIRKRQKKLVSSESGIDSFESSVQRIFNYKTITVMSLIVFVALMFVTGPPKTWIVTFLRYLNFVVVFFTLTGLSLAMLNYSKIKFKDEYLAFSLVGMTLLVAGILIPSFEVSFNISRLYELSFIFISPFCVVGALTIFNSIQASINHGKFSVDRSLKIFSIFLVIFLFFNAGIFSSITNQSVPLHLGGQGLASDYYPIFTYPEAVGALWLSDTKITAPIYADIYGRFLFNRYVQPPNQIANSNGVYDIGQYNSTNSYVYLRKDNANNIMLTGFTSRTNRNRVYENMTPLINSKDEIFDDGVSKIYYG